MQEIFSTFKTYICDNLDTSTTNDIFRYKFVGMDYAESRNFKNVAISGCVLEFGAICKDWCKIIKQHFLAMKYLAIRVLCLIDFARTYYGKRLEADLEESSLSTL